MYQTINFSQFCDAFRAHDRQEQFSYEAKRIIFDYLEQLEEDTGGIELDVIAICCEWAELDAEELVRDYGVQIESTDPEEVEAEVQDYLQDNTIVAGMTKAGSFVFVQF